MSTRSYTTPALTRISGATFRQVDYWARSRRLIPSVCDATGPGTQRVWSGQDVVAAAVFHLAQLDRGGATIPGWLTEITRLIQAFPLDELAGRAVFASAHRCDLFEIDDLRWVLPTLRGPLTVIPLDQFLEKLTDDDPVVVMR